MIDLPASPLEILQRRSDKLKARRMFFRKTGALPPAWREGPS